jgi:hypothetical protein
MNKRAAAQQTQAPAAKDNTAIKAAVITTVGAVCIALITYVFGPIVLAWFGSTQSPAVSTPAATGDYLLTYVSQIRKDALGAIDKSYPHRNYSRQVFARGVMLWWDDPSHPGSGPLYVINYGAKTSIGESWSTHNNIIWDPFKDPVYPPACPETQDRPNDIGPKLGFGKLWCYDRSVSMALGDPLEEEQASNDATIEILKNGILFQVPVDSQVWALLYDGKWQRFDY